MSIEEVLHEQLFKKINLYLSMSGTFIDKQDSNRNVVQRFFARKFYCFNISWVISHLIGEFLWAIEGIRTDSASLVQLTYIIPCCTLCLIGIGKSYFLIHKGDLITDLLRTINILRGNLAGNEQRAGIETEMKKRMAILNTIMNANNALYTSGFIIFAVGPLIITWMLYKSTGDLIMQLPFLSVFPFDATDIKYWPLAYIHQMWAAVVAVSTVHGSDSFYSYSCTLLLIQFKILHYDLQNICPENENLILRSQDAFRIRFREIMMRHNELIRCVDLVENIFSKSTLGNVAVSAIVMCVSAFNVTTIDDIILMTPFIAFFIMWTLQVFVLCYFSDLLIESSTEVSTAVYNSQWYNANAAIMKDLFFVLTRAQKPCKLTAAGYTDLNLRVFTRICSSAWSYFALLQTVYTK